MVAPSISNSQDSLLSIRFPFFVNAKQAKLMISTVTGSLQLSMAVADKDWNVAMGVGEHIIADFPNSRMAEEIKTKMEVLKQNVQYHVMSGQ